MDALANHSSSELDSTTARLGTLALTQAQAQHPPTEMLPLTQGPPTLTPLHAAASTPLCVLGKPPALENADTVRQFLVALPAFRDAYSSEEMIGLFTPACAGCLALYLLHAAEVVPVELPHKVLCALLRDPAGEIVTLSEFQALCELLLRCCSLYRCLLPNPGKCTMFPALAQLLLLRLGALLVSPEFGMALAADRAAAVLFARQYLAEIMAADEMTMAPLVTSKWTEPTDVARASAIILERAQWRMHSMQY